jgi:hypothetical protein
VPEHWQVLQPSTLLQVIVELQPAMGGHPVRPAQPLLLPGVTMLPELLLPEGAPEEEPLLPPPPSGLPSSRALPPHAKRSAAATPRTKKRSERGARWLMRMSV